MGFEKRKEGQARAVAMAMARNLPVVVAGMCGWPRLIPAVSRDLGEALENPWGRVQSGIELVVLYRRTVHYGTPRTWPRVGGSVVKGKRHAISVLVCRFQPASTHGSGDDASVKITACRYGAAVYCLVLLSQTVILVAVEEKHNVQRRRWVSRAKMLEVHRAPHTSRWAGGKSHRGGGGS